LKYGNEIRSVFSEVGKISILEWNMLKKVQNNIPEIPAAIQVTG